MLRCSLVVPALAAALALAVAPTLTAAAVDESDPLPRAVVPTTARLALTEAERALAGRAAVPELEGGRGPTLLLRDLRAAYDDLGTAEQRRADRLMARPVGGDQSETVVYDAGANPTNDCTVAPTPESKVCVHWATGTADAPALIDSDADGVPDYVESVRDEVNEVWRRLVTIGGYRAPLSDADSENPGFDDRLDVYLADLGAKGFYGYCTSDDPDWQVSNQVSAYCVLDDDYSAGEYGAAQTPLDNMRVTAAHEFFHAVQFAYDYWEDSWLMEASSTWVEDEIFDHIDDNRQFLAESPLSHPDVPLDRSDEEYLGQYGAWIFLRYLSERFPDEGGTGLPLVVRRIWERVDAPTPAEWGDYSLQAIANEVDSLGASFTRLFQQFGVANRRPAAFYEEGKAYPVAPLAGSMKVKNTRIRKVVGKPDHLSTATFRVVPGAALDAKRWKAKVKADLPPRRYGYGVAVTVLYRSGKVATRYVTLDAAGDGAVRVPFSRRKVRRLELTLTNASRRYDCWQDTTDSCQGVAKDDGRLAKLKVRAFRRG